jgi:hypothetical protein
MSICTLICLPESVADFNKYFRPLQIHHGGHGGHGDGHERARRGTKTFEQEGTEKTEWFLTSFSLLPSVPTDCGLRIEQRRADGFASKLGGYVFGREESLNKGGQRAEGRGQENGDEYWAAAVGSSIGKVARLDVSRKKGRPR